MTVANTHQASPVSAVKLPRTLVNRLLSLAQNSPQQEICGLIGSSSHVSYTCYPIRNIAATPDIRFALDPAEQIDAMRHMREAGEVLFAVFHSHPSAPARPSEIDLAEASYPDAIYLIISLDTKGVLDMRGFRQESQHTFAEVPLILAE